MPKKDLNPPHVDGLKDIMSVGQIRNPQNPLKGLVGARMTMSIQVPKLKEPKS